MFRLPPSQGTQGSGPGARGSVLGALYGHDPDGWGVRPGSDGGIHHLTEIVPLQTENWNKNKVFMKSRERYTVRDKT